MNDSAPTSVSSSSTNDARELGLDDVVRFLRDSWRWAVGGAVIVGGLAAAWALSQPRTWESSANLLLSPPPFSSELKQLSFNLPSYQRLMESPAVIDETRRLLIEQGVLKMDQNLKVGDNLETKVFMSKKGDDVALVPMIDCRGRGENPAQANAITALWIKVFLERTKALIDSNTSPSFTLIETQFKANQQKLNQLEADNKTAASAAQRKQAEVAQRWNETINTFNAETNQQLGNFQSETEKLMTEMRLSSDLPGIEARIAALSRALSDLNLGAGADYLKSVRSEQNQPVNRGEQVKQISEQLTLLQNKQLTADTAVKKLERERQLKTDELKNQRALELAKLTASSSQELEDLKREETLRQAQFTRESVPLSETVKSLSNSFQQAQITKAQQSTLDIQLASAPTLPDLPMARGASKTIGLAAFLGVILGLGIAMLRQIMRRIDQQPER
jgi:uncharacterized protein involved in exopolysaccharide biosynthesis